MALQYYLVPNHLSPDPESNYMAVSLTPKSCTLEDVFEYMSREGSGITRAEALAVYEEITLGILRLAEEGNSVSTPLVNVSCAVGGVFQGEDDVFDPARHEVRIITSPGVRLRGIAGQVPAKKVAGRERRPILTRYHDNASKRADATVTPGGGARITGSLLKFDEDDGDQGIFFINEEGSPVIRADVPMLRNKPSELIFLNPELPPGTWRLEVRSRPQFTADIRAGTLTARLSVEGS